MQIIGKSRPPEYFLVNRPKQCWLCLHTGLFLKNIKGIQLRILFEGTKTSQCSPSSSPPMGTQS